VFGISARSPYTSGASPEDISFTGNTYTESSFRVVHRLTWSSLVKTLLDERRLVTASSDPRSSSLPIATRVGKNREKRLGKSTVKQFQSSIRVDVKTDAFGTDVLTVVPTLIGWNERDLQTDSDKQTGPVQVLELRWPTQKGEGQLVPVFYI
jgi:hypothetical protein